MTIPTKDAMTTTEAAPRHPDDRVAAIIHFYEHLALDDLAQIPRLYASNAVFKDPFNTVRGVPAIRQIFQHMFDSTEAPSFIIRDVVADMQPLGGACFLTWDFSFQQSRLGPEPIIIHGGTYLRFDANGQVSVHRDYWDAAEELYEKVPVLGALMRWLRRRGAVTQAG